MTPKSIHESELTTRNLAAAQDGIHLLTDRRIRGLIRSLLESRQWWLIPCLNPSAAEFSIEIERRFYADTPNGDFLAFLGPFPITAGRKSRCSPEQLADLLAELTAEQGYTSAQWREAIAEHDILVTVDEDGSDAETLAILTSWHDWVVGR